MSLFDGWRRFFDRLAGRGPSAEDERLIAVAIKNHIEQALLEVRLRQSMAMIQGISKNRMRVVEICGHAGILRTLPGKHEGDG